MIRKIGTTEESGRSMVEMLGVLAIVGVLSIGGIAGYSKAMAKYKINKTLDQLSMLITNIRTTFGNQISYYGLSVENAIKYDIVGNDLTLGSTKKLVNAYNGEVTITAGNASGGECSASGSGSGDAYCPTFTITYKGIEENACVTIASSDWGGSAASGLISITVGTTKFTWGGTASAGKTGALPITFSAAAAACSGATDITWLYN